MSAPIITWMVSGVSRLSYVYRRATLCQKQKSMAGTEEATEVHEVNITEKSDRILKLPLTRIKNIIKVDPDVTLTSTESVVLIAKATVGFCNNNNNI